MGNKIIFTISLNVLHTFTIWWEIVYHCVHKLHHECASQIIYKGCDADSSLEGN